MTNTVQLTLKNQSEVDVASDHFNFYTACVWFMGQGNIGGGG